MNRTFTKLIIVILLGLAVSFGIRNYTLQNELTKLTKNEVRTGWVKAAIENNDSTMVDNGSAK